MVHHSGALHCSCALWHPLGETGTLEPGELILTARRAASACGSTRDRAGSARSRTWSPERTSGIAWAVIRASRLARATTESQPTPCDQISLSLTLGVNVSDPLRLRCSGHVRLLRVSLNSGILILSSNLPDVTVVPPTVVTCQSPLHRHSAIPKTASIRKEAPLIWSRTDDMFGSVPLYDTYVMCHGRFRILILPPLQFAGVTTLTSPASEPETLGTVLWSESVILSSHGIEMVASSSVNVTDVASALMLPSSPLATLASIPLLAEALPTLSASVPAITAINTRLRSFMSPPGDAPVRLVSSLRLV